MTFPFNLFKSNSRPTDNDKNRNMSGEEQDKERETVRSHQIKNVRKHYVRENKSRGGLDPRRIKEGPLLGTGSFGSVFLGVYGDEEAVFAVKRLGLCHIAKSRQSDHVLSEVLSLENLPHPFIVEYIDRFKDDRFLYIVMEYVPGGELFSLLRSNQFFKEDVCRFYAIQIAMIFDYMSMKGYVYRDLKPENVLIGTDGYIKLADFGFTKLLGERETHTLCGTPEYLAPEVILQKGYSYGVDWWTLGILIYEMAYGSPPYSGDTPSQIYQHILSRKISFPKRMSSDCRNILRLLLSHDLDKRLGTCKKGTTEVFLHPWFQRSKFSYEDIITKEYPPSYRPTVKNPMDTSNFSDVEQEESRDFPIYKGSERFDEWTLMKW